MAILKRRFFYHENGSHDERWHYLARDTDTGRVFIVNERAPFKEEMSSSESELADFLAKDNSTAKTNLLELIGSLVEEENA